VLKKLLSPSVGAVGYLPVEEKAMNIGHAAGFVASSLVLIAFCMKQVMPLRDVALASNIAFLMYGAALHLTPVWALHAVLLPINGVRLAQEFKPAPKRQSLGDQLSQPSQYDL
jgi:hypothetical protein